MRAQGLLLFEPVRENRKQAATDTNTNPHLPVVMTASFLSSLDSCEEAVATVSSECTLGYALFMWLASVDVPVEPLHANKAPHGCLFPYLDTSTEHRTEHFLMGGSIAASLSTPMSSSSFSPSEEQLWSPLRGLFSSVRVLLDKEYRTPKWWICHAPPYPGKVQGNHCSGSCSWLSPQIAHLKTTFLTCEAELHHSSDNYYKAMIVLSVYRKVSTQHTVLMM